MKILKLLICIACMIGTPAWAVHEQSSTPLLDAYNGFIKAQNNHVENLKRYLPLHHQRYENNITRWQSTLMTSAVVSEEDKNNLIAEKKMMLSELDILKTRAESNAYWAKTNFFNNLKNIGRWTMGLYVAGNVAYASSASLNQPASYSQEFIIGNTIFLTAVGMAYYSGYSLGKSARTTYKAKKLHRETNLHLSDVQFAHKTLSNKYLN